MLLGLGLHRKTRSPLSRERMIIPRTRTILITELKKVMGKEELFFICHSQSQILSSVAKAQEQAQDDT